MPSDVKFFVFIPTNIFATALPIGLKSSTPFFPASWTILSRYNVFSNKLCIPETLKLNKKKQKQRLQTYFLGTFPIHWYHLNPCLSPHPSFSILKLIYGGGVSISTQYNIPCNLDWWIVLEAALWIISSKFIIISGSRSSTLPI